MRRGLITLTVISVALKTSLPVGAAVDCDKLPSHPLCQDPADPPPVDDRPGAGTTCAPEE